VGRVEGTLLPSPHSDAGMPASSCPARAMSRSRHAARTPVPPECHPCPPPHHACPPVLVPKSCGVRRRNASCPGTFAGEQALGWQQQAAAMSSRCCSRGSSARVAIYRRQPSAPPSPRQPPKDTVDTAHPPGASHRYADAECRHVAAQIPRRSRQVFRRRQRPSPTEREYAKIALPAAPDRVGQVSEAPGPAPRGPAARVYRAEGAHARHAVAGYIYLRIVAKRAAIRVRS